MNGRIARLRVLILGGTADARVLAERLAPREDIQAISSLAGRTMQPNMPEGDVRIGGFGGAHGLAAELRARSIDVVIDATHPFASRMHRNAAEACSTLGLPLIALVRPAWTAQAGDVWHDAEDVAAAAAMAPKLGKRIFLTIGRQEIAPFASCADRFFLVRSIDRPDVALPPDHALLLQRGPFTLADETALLAGYEIDLLVTKNSGGNMTEPKLVAARTLGIPVVMVQRPARDTGETAAGVNATIARLDAILRERKRSTTGQTSGRPGAASPTPTTDAPSAAQRTREPALR